MKYILMLTLTLSFSTSCKKEKKPYLCEDYAYILSRVPGTQDVAACNSSFDDYKMDMRIEASGTMLNRTTMVYCTCGEAKAVVASE